MKEKTGAANKTPDLFKKGRGRPKSDTVAQTGAERVARYRAARKAEGCCSCCGQPLPLKVDPFV